MKTENIKTIDLKAKDLLHSNLKEGQKYSHSILGIITLCDKENLCFADCWNTFHLINLKDLNLL